MARRGDVASIDFHNGLPDHSITHWHGMIVQSDMDGQPIHAIPNGAVYSYTYPIRQRAALNWYHPHPHGHTGEQVYMGLAGAFVVRDAEEDALRLPSGRYEVPLVLRDVTLDASGNLKYQPSAGAMLGKDPLVNGTGDAYLTVRRAVYRFRILNGSNARIFELALDNGDPFILIGNDGGLLPTSSSETQITMSNGERIDVLIDFRDIPDGTTVVLRELNKGWDLVEFRVTGSEVVPYDGALSVASTIKTLPPGVTTRTFTFDGHSKINGLEYDMHRIDWTVPFGVVEEWVFTSGGNGPHPVHVHGVPFQVVSRTGGRGQVFPWERGWKDTVFLDDGETVTIRIVFDVYAGRYLMHCHRLEHEDNGMMANFVVTP